MITGMGFFRTFRRATNTGTRRHFSTAMGGCGYGRVRGVNVNRHGMSLLLALWGLQVALEGTL